MFISEFSKTRRCEEDFEMKVTGVFGGDALKETSENIQHQTQGATVALVCLFLELFVSVFIF